MNSRTLIPALILTAALTAFVASSDAAAPTNDWEQAFQIVRASLDPDTFRLTLTITQPWHPFRIQSHEGPPDDSALWISSAQFQPTNEHYFTYVDELAGSLTTNGRTYRAALGDNLWTINQAFVGYPFLTNPVIRFHSSADSSIIIGYGDGLYSNAVETAVTSNLPAAYFRMWSSNADPRNAVIQVKTNISDTDWQDLPNH